MVSRAKLINQLIKVALSESKRARAGSSAAVSRWSPGPSLSMIHRTLSVWTVLALAGVAAYANYAR
jgi:hypothetical protein